MKKVVAGLLVALLAAPAMAGGHGHFGGYHHVGHGSPWMPMIVGGLVGYSISQAQRPVVVQQPQTVYVYPTQAPVIQMPRQVCELRSEMVNGQIVQGNFCYYQ